MEQPDDQTPVPDVSHDRPPDRTPDRPPGPGAEPGPVASPGAVGSPDDLATVRELILLAYPDVVPELVRGGTIAELRAAVTPAQAAYRQVAERIAAAPAAVAPVPPSVPAGAASVAPPIDGLPPGELIKRALQRRG